ncbi:MAG: hypothetical protein HYV47_02830 [Candidatus Nealsonbacteria bacterium]|nr:hypothetical protein [Candidatus Nealsonbacteria bacterium]
MIKKIVLAVVVLGLSAGGFFYWWNNQADVRGLNKTLPDGVRVVKSLYGNEYKVINKIDGYEFKVPREWRGINEVAYIPERGEEGYTLSSIELEGREESSRIVVMNRFEGNDEILRIWVEKNFKTFGLVGNFNEDKVGELDIVKIQENVHLGGMYVYFFKKDSSIYSITNGSEEFIKYIIINGKW